MNNSIKTKNSIKRQNTNKKNIFQNSKTFEKSLNTLYENNPDILKISTVIQKRLDNVDNNIAKKMFTKTFQEWKMKKILDEGMEHFEIENKTNKELNQNINIMELKNVTNNQIKDIKLPLESKIDIMTQWKTNKIEEKKMISKVNKK